MKRRPRVRAAATELRRHQILTAAQEAFGESGYQGSSLRDIASRAGITHQGLLHHFPDKTALLEAVLDHDLADTATDHRLESGDSLEFFRGLMGVAERDVRDVARMRMFYRLCAEATSPTNPAHGYYVRWFREVRERLTSALQDLAERGRYHGSVPPEVAALHLSAVREGLTLQFLLEPDAVDLAAEVRAHLALYADIG
ncbi:TetR/AcrR family transcriptional regulator [Auraticoccus monumenti]|uniref:TetR/AcrR family transcriptional regulator n=1 Tax=Auraticoccus monumenti TaxID=675864 RepID=UPI00155FB893|nr:TetR/AcrR family transcriptional regulator [Auraticoccus monumenti]